MPDAAANSPVTVYGLSMRSMVTMLRTAQVHMMRNTNKKNTRLMSVRLLTSAPPSAVRRRVDAARREPGVHLGELVRDALRNLVDEVVDPVDEECDLRAAF